MAIVSTFVLLVLATALIDKFISYQEESYIEDLKKLLNIAGEVTVDTLLSRAAYELAHAICSRMLLRAKLSAFKIYKLNQFQGT